MSYSVPPKPGPQIGLPGANDPVLRRYRGDVRWTATRDAFQILGAVAAFAILMVLLGAFVALR